MNLSQSNVRIKSEEPFFLENENTKASLHPFLNFREHYPFNRFFAFSSRGASDSLKESCERQKQKPVEPIKNITPVVVQEVSERRSTIGFPFSWIGKGSNKNHSTNTNDDKRINGIAIESNDNGVLVQTKEVLSRNKQVKLQQSSLNNSIEALIPSKSSQTQKFDSNDILFVEKCKRVIVFDLDDTLIPTCWIRTLLSSKYFYTYEQALVETKRELHAYNQYDFEIELCSLIRLAKSLSHTVVIVTNARSDKWIDTIKYLFPIFFNVIEKNNVPIIRTDQSFEPSHDNVVEYFRFWMNAKKKKFKIVLNEHFNKYQHHINKQIDFISVGDSEFEEIAAYELQSDHKNLVKKAYNIKCQNGLTIENFSGQLRLLQVALSIIAKPSYSYNFLALSSYVQIKMFR